MDHIQSYLIAIRITDNSSPFSSKKKRKETNRPIPRNAFDSPPIDKSSPRNIIIRHQETGDSNSPPPLPPSLQTIPRHASPNTTTAIRIEEPTSIQHRSNILQFPVPVSSRLKNAIDTRLLLPLFPSSKYERGSRYDPRFVSRRRHRNRYGWNRKEARGRGGLGEGHAWARGRH